MPIIVLEGIDASGKQTQTALLKESLSSIFKKVETFDFPHYQGVAGEVVGNILRGSTCVGIPEAEQLDAKSLESLKQQWSKDKAVIIQSIMLADRLEQIEMLRYYYKSASEMLILDRYYLSGLVYGQADGLSLDWLKTIHQTLPLVDAYFLLDISVEESVRRRPERLDYYEKNLEKLKLVRQLYLSTSPGSPAFVVPGESQPETITQVIVDVVKRMFVGGSVL